MIGKDKLKEILRSNQETVQRYDIVPRDIPSDDRRQVVFVGVRRAGKSFMLYQKMQEMLAEGRDWRNMLYLNFEEDRLFGFTLDDFDRVIQCHREMYGTQPWLFLDEIQNIEGWERFARRMADSKNNIWITGSNQKMLSKDIQARLGGRYVTEEVYPYSFGEFLAANNRRIGANDIYAPQDKADIAALWREYLTWGGMPETAALAAGNPMKRKQLSETYGKIYLNDIANRTGIPATNFNLLRLMLKKMAECVNQPVSYANFRHNMSSVSGKVAPQTVSKYIGGCEDAWLILRLRNITASFAEKETACKYYFIDNGFLNLQVTDEKGKLFENAVALELCRRYGHDTSDERVFFYRGNENEVDFYVPEDNLAIQATYTLYGDENTFRRETEALTKFARYKTGCTRLVVTDDEEGTVSDDYGEIKVTPLWKWSLEREWKNKKDRTTYPQKNVEPLVNVAVRLTNALNPQGELSPTEQEKIRDFFADAKGREQGLLDKIWEEAERRKDVNRNGRWLADAKECLEAIVMGETEQEKQKNILSR